MDGKIIGIDINVGLILEAKRRILRRRFSSFWDQFNQFLDQFLGHFLRSLDDEEEHDDTSAS